MLDRKNSSGTFDTSVEAEKVQLQIFRSMSPQQRLQRGIELGALSRKLLVDGVQLRHPEYSEDEVRLAVIRLQLGEKLFLTVYPEAQHITP